MDFKKEPRKKTSSAVQCSGRGDAEPKKDTYGYREEPRAPKWELR